MNLLLESVVGSTVHLRILLDGPVSTLIAPYTVHTHEERCANSPGLCPAGETWSLPPFTDLDITVEMPQDGYRVVPVVRFHEALGATHLLLRLGPDPTARRIQRFQIAAPPTDSRRLAVGVDA